MKEELQGKLVEILTSIQTATGKAADFAMEQLPDIAQSYVAYGRISTIFYVVIAIAVFYGLWRLTKFAYKNGTFEVCAPASLIVSIIGAFNATLLSTNVQSGLLVWCAPKVWLLKELAGMMK